MLAILGYDCCYSPRWPPVSVAVGHFGLSDKSQALALPEGSIRAVIALSLVIIFAILTVFLYGTLASGTQLSGGVEIPGDAATNFTFDRSAFLLSHPNVWRKMWW